MLVGLQPHPGKLVLENSICRVIGLYLEVVPLVVREEHSIMGIRQQMIHSDLDVLVHRHRIVAVDGDLVDVVGGVGHLGGHPVYVVIHLILPDCFSFIGCSVNCPIA